MSKLKLIYLYIFSCVGLVLVIIGSVSFINLGLKTYVFKKADAPIIYPGPKTTRIITDQTGKEKFVEEEQTKEDLELQEKREKEYRTSQRQRDAAQALAFIIIGLPIYLYHWNLVRRKDL